MWDFSKAKHFQLHKLYFFRILAHITEAIFLALQQWKQGLRLLNVVLHLAMSSANPISFCRFCKPKPINGQRFSFFFLSIFNIFSKLLRIKKSIKNRRKNKEKPMVLPQTEFNKSITSLFALQSFAKCQMTFSNRPESTFRRQN